MRFQRIAISCAERGGELVGGILEIGANTLRGKIETTKIDLQ